MAERPLAFTEDLVAEARKTEDIIARFRAHPREHLRTGIGRRCGRTGVSIAHGRNRSEIDQLRLAGLREGPGSDSRFNVAVSRPRASHGSETTRGSGPILTPASGYVAPAVVCSTTVMV